MTYEKSLKIENRPDGIGELWFDSPDGGEQKTLFDFSDYDSSRRDGGAFVIKNDAPMIVRVHTGSLGLTHYSLKIVPAEAD